MFQKGIPFFIGKRLLLLIPTLIGISILIFLVARVIPGDPARLVLGESATPQSLEAVRREMGLDKPVWIQYLIYLEGILHGNLGKSVRTNRPVLRDLLDYFPATLELTLVAIFLNILIAVPLGIQSALKRNSLYDHLSRFFALSGVSIPIFWFGLILIYIFFFLLKWAPAPTGRLGILTSPPEPITGLYILDSLLTGNRETLMDSLKHIILPAFCLSTWPMAIMLRMTRSGMLDVLGQDYIRTARAKGLPRRAIIYRHALKNALIPLITVLGLNFGVLLNGAVLTETIFSWPGMGLYVVESITWLDYGPIQGLALFATVIYAAINITVDILYVIVDPRIKL
jgi:peptide/nickel transport system permease protein